MGEGSIIAIEVLDILLDMGAEIHVHISMYLRETCDYYVCMNTCT